MSELINKQDNRVAIRGKLLAGVSVLALAASISSSGMARAEDADRPTVWIDLGGQMELMQGFSTPFKPPFALITPTPDPYKQDSLTYTQRPPRFAFGADGKITFQPEDSDWSFSAAIRYGRSHNHRHVHHQSSAPPIATYYGSTQANALQELADTQANYNERHAILDFSVGKDIGFGMLGEHSKSTLRAGVRFAQFSVKSTIDITARPFVGVTTAISPKYPFPSYKGYAMQAHAERSFKGIGPSLSWTASAPIVGNEQNGELALDWGLDVAVLFGRQRAKTDHATQAHHNYFYHVYKYHTIPSLYPPKAHHSARSRSVTVPNVGGSIGLSVNYPNVKVSVGYRGDIFFKAIDRGIDTSKTSNLTFNGPYASISIGLGD